MVYLAGDSSLTAQCITVLQQLEAVAYSDNVRLLACFDSNTPSPTGSRYLEISRKRYLVDNGFDWELHNDLVPPGDRGFKIAAPDFCNSNGNGSSKSRRPSPSRQDAAEGVKRFIDWAMKDHKADRYMLIFYGHGPIVASQTFLAKENPPSFLKLKDMRKVLGKHFGPKANRKLSILACSNCVMNGIETAVEVKDEVEFMIGSQGLMLAAGWPYQKMISAVIEDPDAHTRTIARKMLGACARNLLDFTLMDRSSEQAVCDLTKLDEDVNVVSSIRRLVGALKDGLSFKDKDNTRVLSYPSICDAVRLARLEAQSYWGETFVDLSDFCERLLQKCNDLVVVNNQLLKQHGADKQHLEKFRNSEQFKTLKNIICSCVQIRNEVKRMVPDSYYIGPELQYSCGLSIYFPWTRPEAPYFFDRMPQGEDYKLKTTFETYREYEFAEKSQWAIFLDDFFRATLRKVRRAERTFEVKEDSENLDLGLIGQVITPQTEVLTLDLHKTSSDTGKNDDAWPTIKNYPRRNYLSPTDCERKILPAGSLRPAAGTKFPNPTSPPVSYLGWNISQLVAQTIIPIRESDAVAEQKAEILSQPPTDIAFPWSQLSSPPEVVRTQDE
jgi:hypothetical protein